MKFRLLTATGDLEKIVDLEIAIWGMNPRDAVPMNILHAIVRHGGAVIGAYDAERLIGLGVALPLRADGEWILWSHMAGVRADYRGRGIGFAIKQAQRTWALENGYTAMRWTYDPLQRGNANFNLHRLGATARIYHVDFYGEMTDEINAGLPTDRVEVVWSLQDPRVRALAARQLMAESTPSPIQTPFLLRADPDGQPTLDESALAEMVEICHAEIPCDLAALKSAHPELAHQWRIALRGAFQRAFVRGYVAFDFVTAATGCWYKLQLAGRNTR